MSKPQWLSAATFAELAEVPPRTARYALARASEGHPWRGHQLEVRTVHERGGRSGLAYEVSLTSLSEALPEVAEWLPPLPTNIRDPRRAAANQDARMTARLTVVNPICEHPVGSPERAAAIRAAVAAGKGSERTLRRWAEAYDVEGTTGLCNRRPATAGEARITVSREFDRAFRRAGYGEAQLAKVAEVIEPAVKSLWASRAGAAGWREVARKAGFLVWEACKAEGCAMPMDDTVLTRRTVERWRHYTIVNQRRNDRKAYDDAKPRIRRSWGHLSPMDVIVADVKPLDIIVMRPDGTPGWPRLIGFFDPATGRLFVHIVLCAKGEGVRQEHVIEGFLAMVAHPEWGFPRQLYIDNGSEMAALIKIQPALELVNAPGARTVILAKPYNASAKPVESAFARVDRLVTCTFDGYAGRDRMTKKTQTVGKPPKPYRGSFEQFVREFTVAIEELNFTRYVTGERKGRSGMEILAAHVERGWTPITVDPLKLDAAFCDRTELTVRGGAVSVKSVRYVHPQLTVGGRRTVAVALPWRRSHDPLFDMGGGRWAYLQSDDLFPAHWTDGAREAGRRQRAQDRAVAKLTSGAAETDLAPMRGRQRDQRPDLRVARARDRLDVGAEARGLAAGQAAATAELLDEVTEAERLRRVRDRTTERLLRSQANVA